MQYELSKRITTGASVSAIADSVERNMANIGSVTRGERMAVGQPSDGQLGENDTFRRFHVSSINDTFGSINHKNYAVVEIKEDAGGKLLMAHVTYKTSIWFWIILLITLPSAVFWLLPIFFYLYHKKTVRACLVESFDNIYNEFNQSLPFPNPNSSLSNGASFERDNLSKLKDAKELVDSGAITEEEFEVMKKKLLD